MMSRAEVRRSLLAIGVHPRVVDSIVAELPAESSSAARGLVETRRVDEAERSAAGVIADFQRLLARDDAS
jgi:hypothetical protein